MINSNEEVLNMKEIRVDEINNDIVIFAKIEREGLWIKLLMKMKKV